MAPMAPPYIVKTRTKIEEYDEELLTNIGRLKKDISEEENSQKDFMRSYGAPEKMIEEVARKARNEGRPISSGGSSNTQIGEFFS